MPIKFEYRIDRIGVAVDRDASAETTGAAAFVGPDMSVDRVDVDAGC